MLENALRLAAYGYSVFPLAPKTKVPPKGFNDWQLKASSDPATITELFSGYSPQCNVGLAMGKKSGILGLDIDLDNGADPEFLSRLEPTWITKSAHGYHAFYRIPAHWPPFNKCPVIKATPSGGGKPKECVTIRSESHYFVGPGSIHPETGKPYEWCKNQGQWEDVHCDFFSPDEVALAEAPEWLLECVRVEQQRKSQSGTEARNKTGEGNRHDMLTGTAVAMRNRGKSYQDIVDRLVFRNQHDCKPPKENAELEIRNIAKWAMATITPNPDLVASIAEPLAPGSQQSEPGQSARQPQILPDETQSLLETCVSCLGLIGTDYFYSTTSNQQITKVPASGHSSSGLCNLMPYDFWYDCFPGERGPSWVRAGAWLMEQSRKKGIFNAKKIRGAGSWVDESRLVIHTGDRLFIDDKEHGLLASGSKFTYRLGPSFDYEAAEPATIADCQVLIEACKAPSWLKGSSSILFAGHLALLRIGGALPWRPHGWLTGGAGCGKSTVMKTLVATMAGSWACNVQSNTTEAGIRQQLDCDSRPVIFDEFETEDKRSSNRVKGVLELARQSSSDSEGRIYKGTPSGRSIDYKVNSIFLFASINVNLTAEADISRVALYELDRPEPGADSAAFENQLAAVDAELAERVFSRAIRGYGRLVASFEVLRRVIAKQSSQRQGQQYGMLLAGYWGLISDAVIGEAEAGELVQRLELGSSEENAVSSESECLHHLLGTPLRIQLGSKENPQDTVLMNALFHLVHNYETLNRGSLESFGIKIRPDGQFVSIANRHPWLAKAFNDTQWHGNWKQSLLRIPGAKKWRVELCGGTQIHCVDIPVSAILKQ